MNIEIKELSLASLRDCPHCHTAKLLLKKYNIPYKEILWDEPEGEKIIEGLGIERVPVLLVPSAKGLTKIEGEKAIGEWARKEVRA